MELRSEDFLSPFKEICRSGNIACWKRENPLLELRDMYFIRNWKDFMSEFEFLCEDSEKFILNPEFWWYLLRNSLGACKREILVENVSIFLKNTWDKNESGGLKTGHMILSKLEDFFCRMWMELLLKFAGIPLELEIFLSQFKAFAVRNLVRKWIDFLPRNPERLLIGIRKQCPRNRNRTLTGEIHCWDLENFLVEFLLA